MSGKWPRGGGRAYALIGPIAAVLVAFAFSSGAAAGATAKTKLLRLSATPSIVRSGREVRARVVGSRRSCSVALLRSQHLVRVWKLKPHRTSVRFRAGRATGALTVSARCGSKTRIATVWVVSRPHHGMVLLERERRSGLEAGGPIFAPASALAVDALSSSRVAPASVAHDSSSVRAAIVSIAESQHFTGPNASECNPYSAYWEHRSDCANGGFIDAWCADFAAWVWRHAGVSFVYGWSGTEINAAASSFYVWGRDTDNFHLVSSGYQPQPGDVAVYGSLPAVDHVGIFIGGSAAHPTVVNGNWGSPASVATVSNEISTEPRSGGGAPLAGYVSVPSGSGGGGTGTGPGGPGGPTGPGTGPGGPSTSSNNWQLAFNSGSLWTIGVDDRGNLSLGMAPGTNPSITYLTNGGWEGAFQSNDGSLWIVGNDDRGDMQLGMAPGTSPSITAMPNGGWEAAFQAPDGHLWVVGSDDRGDMNLGMEAGTSPSITTLTNGSWEAAWNAPGNDLWVVGPTDVRGDMQLGVEPGTSPSITGLSNGSWEAAWNAPGNDLWVDGPTDVRGDMHLGVASGTNPSIAGLTNGSWQAAWNAPGNDLWVVGPTDVRGDMQLGVEPGTSPSITGLSNGSWEAAWNAPGNDLWVDGPTDVRGDMQLGMSSGTSPSITP